MRLVESLKHSTHTSLGMLDISDNNARSRGLSVVSADFCGTMDNPAVENHCDASTSTSSSPGDTLVFVHMIRSIICSQSALFTNFHSPFSYTTR